MSSTVAVIFASTLEASHVMRSINVRYILTHFSVNDYNILTELRFLNRNEPNLFWTEARVFFLKTELKLNQNKKNLFRASLVNTALIVIQVSSDPKLLQFRTHLSETKYDLQMDQICWFQTDFQRCYWWHTFPSSRMSMEDQIQHSENKLSKQTHFYLTDQQANAANAEKK